MIRTTLCSQISASVFAKYNKNWPSKKKKTTYRTELILIEPRWKPNQRIDAANRKRITLTFTRIDDQVRRRTITYMLNEFT